MKILIIGDSCIDQYTYGICERLCPEAPVPIFQPLETKEFGGMAQNVYNNTLAITKQFFIDCKVSLSSNTNNPVKTRLVDMRTNQMIVRIDKEDIYMDQLNIAELNINQYDAIIVSDYDKGFLSTQDLFILGEHKLSFIDSKRQIDTWANAYNFIKINQYEYQKSKKYIDNYLIHKTIITHGINGVAFSGDIYPVPHKIETIDTSGAGDTFLAAFATTYCYNKSVINAISFAQDCCAKVISKRGTATI